MKKAEQKNFRIEESLTDAHIKFFNKHGYLHFKNFVNKETAVELLQEVENVQSQLLLAKVKKVNGIPLKFGNDADGRPLIQRLAFTSHYSNKLKAFLNDKRLQSLSPLLEGYSARVGENEKDGLVVNHYVNTPNSKFTQMGWHTDSPRDLFLGSRILPMLNVGLHLDSCSFENGGLRVLPGTHKQNLFSLFLKKKYYVDTSADKKEVGFDIEAGDLTVHDGRLWHRVQQSPHIGEASRRRVMYIPIVTGAFKPKHAKSATPFYHKVAQLPNLIEAGKYAILNFIKNLSFAK
jgi:ectoine hydroxylase-related dioxygenase (phytanoyl-CoA dioxygenase family)